jgi:hypothetical protein
MKRWLAAGLLASAFGSALAAQDAPALDAAAAPIFGSVLVGGGQAEDRALDPFLISVVAGGDVAGTDISTECYGFFSSRPTYVIDYQSEQPSPFTIFTYSDNDATLAVQAPDGSITCADDVSPLVLDAQLTIAEPEAGPYAVWVGAISQGEQFPAFLVLTASPLNPTTIDLTTLVRRTNIDREQPQQLDRSVLLTDQAAEILNLDGGGENAVLEEVTGGGTLPLFNIDLGSPACTGFTSPQPTAVLNLSASVPAMRVYFEGDGDGTLLVIAPDGRALCNDDSDGAANLNPLVNISAPQQGRYVIYVGSYDPVLSVTGTLSVATAINSMPMPLLPATPASGS